MKGLSSAALTEKDLEEIKSYEEAKGYSAEPTPEMIEYSKKLMQDQEEQRVMIDPVRMGKAFIAKWNEMYPVDPLQLTDDMKRNLRTLNYYLADDERFAEGCSELSEPSLRKGLLIIGPFGNGKSSAMSVYHQLLSTIPGYSFKSFTSTQVVDMYEACSNPSEKKVFWKSMLTGRCHFDDLLREREASNYGKVEIFRDILLKRYDAQMFHNPELKTFITCNPLTSDRPDTALDHIAEKYGEIMYDRIFKMFNIVFWNGKSFRK